MEVREDSHIGSTIGGGWEVRGAGTHRLHTVKVPEVDQTTLIHAKAPPAEAMKKHAASNHETAMAEIAGAMTMITQARA
jgi:hypothetical protein